MENPAQSAYTVEELFTLKPHVITVANKHQISPTKTSPINQMNAVFELQTANPGFWGKNKSYMIAAGFIVVGGLLLYWYVKNQRNKKDEQE